MPSDYWNGRNEVFVKTFQKLNGITADGLAGEETFTTLDLRSWPLRNLPDGRKVIVTNGYRPGEHNGIDIFWYWKDGDQLIDGYWTPYAGQKVWYPFGTMAVAACDGVVIRNEEITTGWIVTLRHANEDTTGYIHGRAQTSMVELGQQVKRGQPVFYCGWSTKYPGPSEDNVVHLHFSVVRDGKYLDPEKWLQYASRLDACQLDCPDAE
jgi:murein DD-endopeptidase MepM/ murein hydrolase activator NlpD